MIKMDKLVVIGILFIIFFVVCCTCSMREGYISDIVTGPNDNTLVINDDKKPVAVITDNDDIYINEDAINDDDNDFNDAEINNYYGKYGNSVSVARGPRGNTAVAANVNNLSGNQSDYILKSQIVPPVCPVCPSLVAANDSDSDSDNDSDSDSKDDDDGDNNDSSGNGNGDGDGNGNGNGDGDGGGNGDGTCTSESCYKGNTYKREVNVKCPPCPPCARCPEPAFDCKKVPTYKESDDRYLPKPILSDFSTFGM